jgi:hypothetical protein
MSHDQTTITCPECGAEIDVNDILYHQVDEQLKAKYQEDLSRERDKFNKKRSDLKKEQKALEEEKARTEEAVGKRVKSELKKRVVLGCKNKKGSGGGAIRGNRISKKRLAREI